MVSRKAIAIIPARGGSKRLPGKNIIPFLGMPMIARTIKAAKDSKLFDRIIVSTDDEKIVEVSRKYGAEVPFLRTEKADDHSPVSQATLFALMQAEKHFAENYEIVVQLMANCPLRDSGDIIDAYNNFNKQKADFQISCFKYGFMNPWWAATLDDKGHAEKIFPEEADGIKRSQDLPKLYCPTGAIWIAKSTALKQAGTFYGKNYIMHPMPWDKAVDIDDNDDLKLALALAVK